MNMFTKIFLAAQTVRALAVSLTITMNIPTAVVLVSALVATNCWATTYDPAASFEQGYIAQTNPNGVWSYGYSDSFASPITLYNQTVQNGVNGQNAQYWLSPSVDYGTSPAAEFNNGPAFDDGNVNFLANSFILVAGIGGQYSDLIFTAPTSGIYSLASTFRGDQYGVGTVVGVSANGSMLFSSTVGAEGQTVPFDADVDLTAGEQLVFSVGPGGGLQNTGLSAAITSTATTTVPEPSSFVLLAVGISAIVAAACSRIK